MLQRMKNRLILDDAHLRYQFIDGIENGKNDLRSSWRYHMTKIFNGICGKATYLQPSNYSCVS